MASSWSQRFSVTGSGRIPIESCPIARLPRLEFPVSIRCTSAVHQAAGSGVSRSMMHRLTRPVAKLLAALTLAGIASGCSSTAPAAQAAPEPASHPATLDQYALLDRVSWGATASSLRAIRSKGTKRWLDEQLHPRPDAALPPQVARSIASLSIESASMSQRVIALEQLRGDADKIPDEEARKTARKGYQDELNGIGRETATRMLLRALYSPNQLQEQMT